MAGKSRTKATKAAPEEQKRETFAGVPVDVSGADMAFGPRSMARMMPSYAELCALDVPSEWQSFVGGWFFRGLKAEVVDALKARDGIDKSAALRHVRSVLGSWEPKHEHKELGCAYLMHLWFEAVP